LVIGQNEAAFLVAVGIRDFVSVERVLGDGDWQVFVVFS
jgi:hypothetical protein